MVPTPATPDTRRTRPSRTRTPTWSFKHGLTGADPSYDYGTHFLFQGHEGGVDGAGYITRINLDADAAHRVTLLATRTERARRSPRSTARPGTRGRSGCCSPPRTRATRPTRRRPTIPSTVDDVSGALGRGGYEGIQNDSDGNIWIVEDVGGANKRRHDREAAQQLRLPLRPGGSRAT